MAGLAAQPPGLSLWTELLLQGKSNKQNRGGEEVCVCVCVQLGSSGTRVELPEGCQTAERGGDEG